MVYQVKQKKEEVDVQKPVPNTPTEPIAMSSDFKELLLGLDMSINAPNLNPDVNE